MKLSKRQEEIVGMVKDRGPITGDEISKILGLSRGTIRPDLSILTKTGILGARPKVGYFYTGNNLINIYSDKIRNALVRDYMSIPVVSEDSNSVYECIVSMFLENIGSVFLTSGGYLSGIVSRKDMLRTALGKYDLNTTPVGMIMTRMPNVVFVKPSDTILKAAEIIEDRDIDALPVVEEEEGGYRVVGRFTKTNVNRLFVEFFKEEM